MSEMGGDHDLRVASGWEPRAKRGPRVEEMDEGRRLDGDHMSDIGRSSAAFLGSDTRAALVGPMWALYDQVISPGPPPHAKIDVLLSGRKAWGYNLFRPPPFVL